MIPDPLLIFLRDSVTPCLRGLISFLLLLLFSVFLYLKFPIFPPGAS